MRIGKFARSTALFSILFLLLFSTVYAESIYAGESIKKDTERLEITKQDYLMKYYEFYLECDEKECKTCWKTPEEIKKAQYTEYAAKIKDVPVGHNVMTDILALGITPEEQKETALSITSSDGTIDMRNDGCVAFEKDMKKIYLGFGTMEGGLQNGSVNLTIIDNSDECRVGFANWWSPCFTDYQVDSTVDWTSEEIVDYFTTGTATPKIFQKETVTYNTTCYNITQHTLPNETIIYNYTPYECWKDRTQYYEEFTITANESIILHVVGAKAPGENKDNVLCFGGLEGTCFPEFVEWNDTGTALDYWASNETRGVWFNLTLDSDNVFQIEINSSQASDTGNGYKIFELFDAFEAGSLNATTWNLYGGAPVFANGQVTLQGVGDKIKTQNYYEKFIWGHAIGTYAYYTHTGYSSTKEIYMAFMEDGGAYNSVRDYKSGAGYYLYETTGGFFDLDVSHLNSWAYHDIYKVNSTNASIYLNDTFGNESSGVLVVAAAGIDFKAETDALIVEHIFVRKFNENATITISCSNISSTKHRCNITTDTNLTDYQVLIPYSEVGSIGSNLSAAVSEEANVTPTITNVSLLAVDVNISDTSFSSSSYVEIANIEFNTTPVSTDLLSMISLNLEKTTGAEIFDNDIWMLVQIDGIDQSEVLLRKITGKNEIGSAGHYMNHTGLGTGEHNISIQFKRTGVGSIAITDFNYNLGQMINNEGNAHNGSKDDIDTTYTGGLYVRVSNFTQPHSSSSSNPAGYMAFSGSFNASGATKVSCRFRNVDDSTASPLVIRSLADNSDTGSLGVVWIDTYAEVDANITFECKEDSSQNVSIDGSVIQFDLDDQSGNNVSSFNDTAGHTDSSPLQLSAGVLTSIMNTSFTPVNGTEIFITYTSSVISDTGTDGDVFYEVNITNSSSSAICSTEQYRSYTSLGEAGSVQIYYICTGMTEDDAHNIEVFVTSPIAANYTYDSLAGFEVVEFDVFSGTIAPIPNDITAPAADNDTIAENYLLTWLNFTDPSGTLDNYTIYLKNSSGYQWNITSNNTNLSYTLDTTAYLNGQYTLYVEGFSSTGLSANSTRDTIIKNMNVSLFIETYNPFYNGTHLGYNFTVIAINTHVNETDFNVSLDVDGGEICNNAFVVSSGDFGTVECNYTGTRPVLDDNITITATITDAVNFTTSVNLILPIDPPSAIALKAGADVGTRMYLWNGSNWVDYDNITNLIKFRCSGDFPEYCQPTNQDNATAQPIFRNNNNGTATATWSALRANTTWTTASLLCDDQVDPTTALNLSTSLQNYSTSNLTAGANSSIYCWFHIVDVTGAFPREFEVYAENG